MKLQFKIIPAISPLIVSSLILKFHLTEIKKKKRKRKRENETLFYVTNIYLWISKQWVILMWYRRKKARKEPHYIFHPKNKTKGKIKIKFSYPQKIKIQNQNKHFKLQATISIPTLFVGKGKRNITWVLHLSTKDRKSVV